MRTLEVGSTVGYKLENAKVTRMDWSDKKYTAELELSDGETVTVPVIQIIWNGSTFFIKPGWYDSEEDKRLNLPDSHIILDHCTDCERWTKHEYKGHNEHQLFHECTDCGAKFDSIPNNQKFIHERTGSLFVISHSKD